jgi:hypothetical protein
VMDTGSDLDRIVRSCAQIILHTRSASEFSIILISHTLVPVRQCLRKCRKIHIDLCCKILNRIALDRDAGRNILLSCLKAFAVYEPDLNAPSTSSLTGEDAPLVKKADSTIASTNPITPIKTMAAIPLDSSHFLIDLLNSPPFYIVFP